MEFFLLPQEVDFFRQNRPLTIQKRSCYTQCTSLKGGKKGVKRRVIHIYFRGNLMIKSKIKKVFATSLIVLTSLSFFSSTSFGGTIQNGVNRPVWYSPSVASYGNTSHFDAGRDYWNKDTTVNLWKWDQSNNSTDRYFIGTIYNGTNADETIGLTTPYKVVNGRAVLASYDENWNFSAVTMYDSTMKKIGMSRSQVEENAAHEVGHSVKMKHSSGTYSPT